MPPNKISKISKTSSTSKKSKTSASEINQNLEQMQKARQYFPGGVNSPVRSFGAVGGNPLVAVSGSGPLLRDADAHDYIDLCCSWGALPLGHADPRVQKVVLEQLQSGFSFGMPTAAENLLARRLQELLPQLERMRFVNSGTEAVMSALRLARAHSGRDLVLKFDGCYHGHVDYLLVEAGSGVSELATGQGPKGPRGQSRPSSTGVPQALANLCESIAYNDLAAAKQKLASEKFAAVIVEPIAANMGLVLPEPGFLEGLREACDQSGTLLVFDEVITGLRLPPSTNELSGPSSAADYFGVQPDLSCFGKAVSGGLPLAVYGGRKEIMQQLSPEGDCYQAGTLAGNPLAVLGGLATIEALVVDWPVAYPLWQSFVTELEKLFRAEQSHGLASCGSLLTMFPFAQKLLGHVPHNFAEAKKLAQQKHYPAFFHFLLERDIYLSPSPYEALFLSTAHDAQALQFVLTQVAEYCRTTAKK